MDYSGCQMVSYSSSKASNSAISSEYCDCGMSEKVPPLAYFRTMSFISGLYFPSDSDAFFVRSLWTSSRVSSCTDSALLAALIIYLTSFNIMDFILKM